MTANEVSLQTSTPDPLQPPSQGKSWSKREIWRKLVCLPYLVGIGWTCLHPVASVMTGNFSRSRSIYTDENSLDPNSLSTTIEYRVIPPPSDPVNITSSDLDSEKSNETNQSNETAGTNDDSAAVENDDQCEDDGFCLIIDTLCDALERIHDISNEGANMFLASNSNDNDSISCFKHEQAGFHVAQLTPTANIVEPSDEAIVLVAPYPATGSWATNQLHYSLLEMLQVLASPERTQWLAKTILLVSPSSDDIPLETMVDRFLDSHMGTYESSRVSKGSVVPPLPAIMSKVMIRNLLVLDSELIDDEGLSETQKASAHIVEVLPHGRRGVLPNMDLVSVVTSVFSRKIQNADPDIRVHSYGEYTQGWNHFVRTNITGLDRNKKSWAMSMGHLLAFMYTQLHGPYAPHAAALDRGVDAITIRGRFRKSQATNKRTGRKVDLGNPNRFEASYVKKLEILLRALSNLHERLHHSTTLYLLLSSQKFVKHEEYLVPNLLLLTPLIIRVASLLLLDIRQLHHSAMGWPLLVTVCATVFLDVCLPLFVATGEAEEDILSRNALLAVTYTICFGIVLNRVKFLDKPSRAQEMRNALQSLQVVVCLSGIYLHVPIAFGHVSLAYGSCLLWAPFLSFASFAEWYKRKILALLGLPFLAVTWAPAVLLPTVFHESVTPYVQFVYIPLHLLLSLSCLLGLRVAFSKDYS